MVVQVELLTGDWVLTNGLGAVLVTPVHLQPVLGLPAGRQLVLGLLQGPSQGPLNCRYQLDLLQQLLLRLVLHQVVVDPPLPVAEAVPGDVEGTLSGLDGVLQPPLLHSEELYLCRLNSCESCLLAGDKINIFSTTHHVSNCFLQLELPQIYVLQSLPQPLRHLRLGGVRLVHGRVDELLGLLPRVLRSAPVLLALEVLVLIVARPVVSAPLLEGVSVHWVGGDVPVQDGLLLHLRPGPDNPSLEESAVILNVLLGHGEGSHCGHLETVTGLQCPVLSLPELVFG